MRMAFLSKFLTTASADFAQIATRFSVISVFKFDVQDPTIQPVRILIYLGGELIHLYPGRLSVPNVPRLMCLMKFK